MKVLTARQTGAKVERIGRWLALGSYDKGQWPAVGLRFKFKGKMLQITLEDGAKGTPHEVKGTNSNTLSVIIDKGEPRTITLNPGVGTYSILHSDQVETHVVEIYKRTESMVGPITWKSLSIDAGAALLPQGPPRPRLDVYGDSNSCGYGVEAAGKDEKYSPSTQNAAIAFGKLAADALGCNVNLISASGWGISRGYGGESEAAIPRVHQRYFIDEAKPVIGKVKPAYAIVIVLGDNDHAKGSPGPEFEAKYAQFVKELRQAQPKTPVFMCASASMEEEGRARIKSTYQGIKQATKDPNLYHLELNKHTEAEGWGADWHLSKKAQERVGAELAAKIKEALRPVGRAVEAAVSG